MEKFNATWRKTEDPPLQEDEIKLKQTKVVYEDSKETTGVESFYKIWLIV